MTLEGSVIVTPHPLAQARKQKDLKNYSPLDATIINFDLPFHEKIHIFYATDGDETHRAIRHRRHQKRHGKGTNGIASAYLELTDRRIAA